MNNLLSWLEEGPYTLALSSSFFGFFAHAGAAESLLSLAPPPARLSGSSAGALVAAALASGLTPEDMKELFFGIRKNDFWDPGPGLGLLRGKKMLALLEKSLAASFEQVKTPVSAAVFDIFAWRGDFLRKGSLPQAVAASCSVPVLFHPVRIGARLYADGGITNKAGVEASGRQERILSILISSRGATELYEKRKAPIAASPDHRVIRLSGLPRPAPHRLELGPEAYAEARARMQEALMRPPGRRAIQS